MPGRKKDPNSIVARKEQLKLGQEQFQEALHDALVIMQDYAKDHTINVEAGGRATPLGFLKLHMTRQRPPVYSSETFIADVGESLGKPSASLACGLVAALTDWNASYPDASVNMTPLMEAASVISTFAPGLQK